MPTKKRHDDDRGFPKNLPIFKRWPDTVYDALRQVYAHCHRVALKTTVHDGDVNEGPMTNLYSDKCQWCNQEGQPLPNVFPLPGFSTFRTFFRHYLGQRKY